MNKLRETIGVLSPGAILLDPAEYFDNCVIGLSEPDNRVVYSVRKIIDLLIDKDGMGEEEAWEYFHYNIAGAHMGEKTPIYVDGIEEWL